jgi:uncharacterized membrane protein (DUF106 family)
MEIILLILLAGMIASSTDNIVTGGLLAFVYVIVSVECTPAFHTPYVSYMICFILFYFLSSEVFRKH